MKIQAKDVVVGMMVKSSKIEIRVQDILIGSLKNGTTTVTLIGSAAYKTSDRPVCHIDRYEWTLRENTLVNI